MPERCDRCGRRDTARVHACRPVDTDTAHAVRRIDAAVDDLRSAPHPVDASLADVALNAVDRIERAADVLHAATRRRLARRNER